MHGRVGKLSSPDEVEADDGSEGCALDFSAWWRQETGDPRDRDYINQRLKSETASEKTDIRRSSISKYNYRGIFVTHGIISALGGYHDIYWGNWWY